MPSVSGTTCTCGNPLRWSMRPNSSGGGNRATDSGSIRTRSRASTPAARRPAAADARTRGRAHERPAARKAELEHRQTPSRTHDACQLAARRLGSWTLRIPKATAAASTELSTNGTRVASPRTSPTRGQTPRWCTFASPSRNISCEKSMPTTRAAPAPRGGGQRHVGGPGAQVQQRLAPCEPKGSHGLGAPPLIQSAAQDAIQQIVVAGDRVEHAGDAIGFLGAETGIDDVVVDGVRFQGLVASDVERRNWTRAGLP